MTPNAPGQTVPGHPTECAVGPYAAEWRTGRKVSGGIGHVHIILETVVTAISANSIKSLLSLLAIPGLAYAAVLIEPGGAVQIVFWLVAFGLLASCFVHLGRLLGERGLRWRFLLPGCLILLVGGAATLLGMFLIGGGHSSDPTTTMAFGVAFLLITIGAAIKYNADRLGIVDGVIVTFLQILFALLIVGLIAMVNIVLNNRRGRY